MLIVFVVASTCVYVTEQSDKGPSEQEKKKSKWERENEVEEAEHTKNAKKG